MAGISRTRSRNSGGWEGSWVSGGFAYPAGTTFKASTYNPKEICSDVVGNPRGDNPLSITREFLEEGGINGTVRNGNSFYNYPTFFETNKSYWAAHLTAPPSAFRDATQAIMDSHPGDSDVSIPNFGYEMKDIPSMLTHAGRRAESLHRSLHRRKLDKLTKRQLERDLRQGGEDWLNYHFGWKPFFSDLVSIIGIADDVIQRQRRIQKAKDRHGGYITTRVGLGDWSDTVKTQSNIKISSANQASVNVDIWRHTTIEKWAVAKWDVDLARFSGPVEKQMRTVISDCLGLGTLMPVQIWDAMPWSWLFDWCVNFRAYASMQWMQGIRFKSACVMSRSYSQSTPQITGISTGLTYSGMGGMETKSRSLFSPTFVRTDLGKVIMSPSKLATLASLKVTRGAGSSHF